MTTIIWNRLTPDSFKRGNVPDMDINVLLAHSSGDVREGFLSTNHDDRVWWYDVTGQPLDDVVAWAEMPEYQP